MDLCGATQRKPVISQITAGIAGVVANFVKRGNFNSLKARMLGPLYVGFYYIKYLLKILLIYS